MNLLGVPIDKDLAARNDPVVDPGPLTRNGYFLLDDSRTALWDKTTEWVRPRVDRDGQDWYFFMYGNDYVHALREMSTLLGSIPMVPRYMLGTWFSSRAGYSGESLKMIVERFREESLPLDVVALDSCSWAKGIWSGYDWDLEQIPDPKGFIQWMRKHGIRVSLNEHYSPITRESESNFEIVRRAMGLPPETREISHDLASKKYAQLFMDVLHKPALDLGMAFWWQDGNAGASMEGLDPMMWTRHIEYTGAERITRRRAFVFCRIGDWGSHRYGTYFTGDLTSSWETLEYLVPAMQQAGNMLEAYMINTFGGFGLVNMDAEFYRRWMQFSSLNPIMWLHSPWGMRLPWEYGPEGMDTYRTFAGLRYSLIPYIYTYSRVSHETGLPLVRGMYIGYPDQEPSYSYRQQYTLGKELLVAPITRSGNGKPVLTEVYLPAGKNWFDYFTGDIYKGGKAITHECPIERMPLFVASGSILPMAPRMDFSDQKSVDPLTLDLYAGGKATFRLYEDDGISLDYRSGAYAWTQYSFEPDDTAGDYVIRIGPTQGKFQGQLNSRRYMVRLHGLLKPEAVTLNGKMLAELAPDACSDGWSWDGRARVMNIRLMGYSLPTDREAVLMVKNAGTFGDALVLQKALNLRAQVRQIKRELKMKWVSLTKSADVKKPPRVIRRTEEVERSLDSIIRNPKNSGRKPPDFAAMRQRVLDALVDQPFESSRIIPDINTSSREIAEAIANASFTTEEIKAISAILLGADLPGRGTSR